MITPEQVKEKTPERFWSKVNFGEVDDCWEWQHRKDPNGYGRLVIKINGKWGDRLAHRYFYEAIFGTTKRLNCLHKCDNTSCVNPNHIFLGTQRDNVMDMRKKNRGNYVKGSKIGSSKLTEEKVILIKERLRAGETHRSIAKAFDIVHSTITHINTGFIWKHVILE